MIPASQVPPGAARYVDLHAHSTASDGSRAPADVIREARRIGLAAIALTDHDTIDGIAEAQSAGAAVGIRVIAGVELSAVENDHETHVLGLHLARLDTMHEQLAGLRGMRLHRAQRMVDRLNDIGVRITLESVLEQAGGGAVGRPHVARALIGEGWATDARDAFDRYLGAGRPGYVAKDRLTMADAIAIIHRAGGLAVIAHPGGGGTRERVEALVALGIDGIEVKHPSHGAEDIARLTALVEHYGLVPSGGSDWHGAADGPRLLGAMRIPYAWLDRQDARIAARAA